MKIVNYQKHFLSIVEYYNRYTWMLLLEPKINSITERKFNKKIKVIRNDKGTNLTL